MTEKPITASTSSATIDVTASSYMTEWLAHLLSPLFLEAPSIGWQLFALDSSQGDKKALVLSLDTYGTRLLTEALRWA